LADQHYGAALAVLIGGFALTASVAKLSQLQALALNAEDFWLFQDMLAQMARGGFFITRYAPQALGWVQHGAVHPMLSWAIALPLAWVAGPTAAALLFGPLVFAGAGWVLALIAKPRWGALGALMAAAAFLASSQLGKILMYDVHPEAAYPLFVFLWAWSAGWGDGKLRPAPLLLSTALLMGIKEDSFVVLPPLILATALFQREATALFQREATALFQREATALFQREATALFQREATALLQSDATPPLERGTAARKWLALSAALAAVVCVAQLYTVHQLAGGAWGPQQWQGAPVGLPRGAELMRNRHWDSLSSAFGIVGQIASEKGGVPGVIWSFARFLFSRPWLSLLLVAPWVLLQRAFWISVLPLMGVYSLLEDPGKFINYYSAPVLGSFWLAAVCTRSRAPARWLWLLSVSLVLGGGGIDFYLPAEPIRQASQQASDLVSCLPAHAQGVVSGRFVGLVPPDRIFSDRVPPEPLERADFYLFSEPFPSFEIPPPAAQTLEHRLQSDPRWTSIGVGCHPAQAGGNPLVLLFIKRS
jgi:hypothetical protein